MIRAVAILACVLASSALASADAITDQASAIQAAKKYLKARCTTETPCKFKALREGKQWSVFVEFTKRLAPNGEPVGYPGGHATLYFGSEGSLLRYIPGE
ncbi:hypothetical protein BWI17_03755 [Betaproteobacteria bacterium GR16-43]|nr:hypothetical protein BWI17_03755 [Betaproteobacteria bacterium GR16-43]